jgi:hypothetical protein
MLSLADNPTDSSRDVVAWHDIRLAAFDFRQPAASFLFPGFIIARLGRVQLLA